MAGLKISVFVCILSLAVVGMTDASVPNCVFHVTKGEMAQGSRAIVIPVLTLEECQAILLSKTSRVSANFVISLNRYRNSCVVLKRRPTKFIQRAVSQYITGKYNVMIRIVVLTVVIAVAELSVTTTTTVTTEIIIINRAVLVF